MGRHVSDIAFTAAVKAKQDRLGPRGTYARMEGRGGWSDRITQELAHFVRERDSFYPGTACADGRPYIQHRGGPAGRGTSIVPSTSRHGIPSRNSA